MAADKKSTCNKERQETKEKKRIRRRSTHETDYDFDGGTEETAEVEAAEAEA